ncbi:MAG TPA: amidohydrolase, partial [Clostridiales bacterium]|jgi:5-methylthioadenosine/S-adenosylhomocysteine deaminase|nr:amidohydrolase [Clostridiales bacterium]
VLFKNISILNDFFDVKENMYVGVENGIINFVGEKKPDKKYETEIDGSGKLLAPGFFNLHSHAAMTILRGYAENLPLDRWLNEKIFPFEARLTEQDVYNGVMLAAAEMLRFGIVSFSDMYMFGAATARAVSDSGLKCNLSVPVFCFDDKDADKLPVLNDLDKLMDEFKDSKNIIFELAVHAEYTSTEKAVRNSAEYAKDRNLGVHIHLSETKKEHEESKIRHGKTPAEYFADCGLFDLRTTAAHCVYVEDRDLDILKEHNVSPALNPASNMKLASGFAPVPKMLEKGINICLGTDGAASSNNLNMQKDLYLLSIIYKAAYEDAAAVSYKDCLKAATVNGAKAQNRPDTGVIKEGCRADLRMIDTEWPNMRPATDMASNLVYALSGGENLMTMVDGRILYYNNEYYSFDIEKVKHEAERSVKRIISELDN